MPEPAATPTSAYLAKVGGRIGLVLWAVVVTLGSSILLGRHLLTLPVPERTTTEAALQHARLPAERGRWLAVHVLYDECACSQKLLDHLLESTRPTEVAELILWVGGSSPRLALARAKGFRVAQVTSQQLAAEYDIQAAPLLVVADPTGSVRYVGGYSARKQGADVRDLQIIAGLRDHREQKALPLFGCAVSRALQQKLDPLAHITGSVL